MSLSTFVHLCPLNMLLTNKTYKKVCLFCRKEFDAQNRTTKYCSWLIRVFNNSKL